MQYDEKKSIVTMKMIAKLAGVSRAAVSAVVNGKSSGSIRVSPHTRKRIEAIITQTGYRPNPIGKALISGQSYLIGLVVESASYSFIPEFIEAIEDETESRHYGIILVSTRGQLGRQQEALEFMLEKQVDGLILTSPNEMSEPNIRQKVSSRNLPIVHLSYQPENPLERTASVTVDGASIARIGIEHLMKLGHKHIVCVQFSKWLIDGTLEVVKKSDAAVEFWSEAHAIDGPMTEIINRWKNTKKQPTAFFINADSDAIVFMNKAMRYGVKVPDELSIVGIDDIPQATDAIIPLTTVYQPKYEQGQAAIRLLFDMLDGKKPQNIMLQPKLIVRDSTAKIL